MKFKESLNVTFDESLPPTKLSPLVDDDVGEEEAIKNNIKVVNNNNEEDESIEVNEVVNIKESKNHPLDQMSMIGELNFFLGFQIKQMEDGIFFNQSKYIKEMLKKFGLEDSKPIRTSMSTKIKLTRDDEAASVDSSKYQGTKMPSEYQQDYKKTRAYALKIYNDPNMSDELRDIYRNLESRYVHEGRTIEPSFYNDLSDDLVAKFTAIGNRDHTQAVIALMFYFLENEQSFNLAYFIIRMMYFFRDRKDKVLPYGMILTRLFKNLKANITEHPFDERYKLVPRKMSSLKEKQPKKPPPKRSRNVGKSKRPQLTTSSSTESPPSDNGDLPSTKLSLRSYSRALKDDPNMLKKQRETRGMFKNMGRELHNFARMFKKGCR
uniref:Retrovirus-related Pol polyprotein from transposon TNT 1-94 n=1 Tax=Tanacetum cinerariifolium TaxID=118510 RepID=A0A699GIN5_TANCI|nr:retrovirus-related Pol polyprotein from transposon TNT 1-94 [Tanacetum cinerariifolium]